MAEQLDIVTALGITREEILDKIVDRYVEGHAHNDDWYESQTIKSVEKELKARMEQAFQEIFHKNVDEGIVTYLEGHVEIQKETHYVCEHCGRDWTESDKD